MKIAKHYLCKKSAYSNGEKTFEARQKYQHHLTMGNVIFLKLKGENVPMTKEFFKQHFRAVAI